MHAYLIIGNDELSLEKEIIKIVKKNNSDRLEFSIQKIDGARELGKFLKLSINKKTVICIRDVDSSTPEALNAFLKNLEEPQVNVTYILTARNEYRIIPTILSRCEIIRTAISHKVDNKTAKSYLSLTTSERLLEISKIRKRDEALNYMQNLILSLHQQLIKGDENIPTARVLQSANETLNALNANGNVALQLSNFAINT